MSSERLAVVVLAAGMGTRMKSARAKVLHEVAGKPMLRWVLDAAEALAPEKIVVVVGPGQEAVAEAAAPHATVVQERRLGTADAVEAARAELEGWHGIQGRGDVLVLYGDVPFVSLETLRAMLALRRHPDGGNLVLLGFEPADPHGYGRLILDGHGQVIGICEQSEIDANPAMAAHDAIGLCNAGTLLADGEVLFAMLERVDNDNAKGEYYLTDIFELANHNARRTQVIVAPEEEVMGINDRADLAEAERIAQDRLRREAMLAGATLIGAETIFLREDTVLGPDTVVHPHVVFGPGVTVARGCEIKSFSHLEGCTLAEGAVVGPYARLRPGAEIGEGAKVGNFVEVKNATLRAGAKANHLTYLGDAEVGAEANIGAGTITCNYDGFGKHRTEIGAGAFIGSNAALVAPVRIGAGAIVGAGSTITEDVADEALAVARGQQKQIEGGATRFRAVRQKSSAKAKSGS
jgi:bifunctional UDP-N-acetylglucosamine pyrophosphorylase/glucosamine-1-phosphate N-acetyltransferase